MYAYSQKLILIQCISAAPVEGPNWTRLNPNVLITNAGDEPTRKNSFQTCWSCWVHFPNDTAILEIHAKRTGLKADLHLTHATPELVNRLPLKVAVGVMIKFSRINIENLSNHDILKC